MGKWDFISDSAELAAPRLLGCYLIRDLDDQQLIGKIIETEAYDQADAASHSYHGKTQRTAVMFGPPGHLYVYFTYGMHYCCNIVTGPEGYGAAVLIRAIEPLDGQELMSQYRHGVTGVNLTNGPAKLCQAFNIDKAYNGHDLRQPPLKLLIKPALPKLLIGQSRRIGIRQATDKRWRFYVLNSPFVSKL
jgi:DNA-3-methyladenine glycosylase